MSEILCDQCHTPMDDGAKFCESCGTQAALPAPSLPRNRLLANPTATIDDGTLFHRGFFAWILVVGALVVLFELFNLGAGLLGDGGWFRQLKVVFDDAAFFGLRSIVCTLLTFAISVAALAAMMWLAWRRAGELRSAEYRGLTVVLTRVIKVAGEVTAVVPIVASINVFLGMIFLAAPVGIPFGQLPTVFFSPVVKPFLVVIDVVQKVLGSQVDSFGHYLSRAVLPGALTVVAGLLASFLILVAFYWLAEFIGVVYGFLIHRPLFSGRREQESLPN